jgi:hypothetical protein
MSISRDDFHTSWECLKITLLRGAQRVLLKEWNNRLQQIVPPSHEVLAEVLAVVVMSPIDRDPPNPEEALKLFEAAAAPLTLRHNEPVEHLVAGLVAWSAHPIILSREADREASFSIYKANDPATELDQPFLLVFRTRHVVTVDVAPDATSSARFSGFPAYSQMHTVLLPARGAANIQKGRCTVLFDHVTLGRL